MAPKAIKDEREGLATNVESGMVKRQEAGAGMIFRAREQGRSLARGETRRFNRSD